MTAARKPRPRGQALWRATLLAGLIAAIAMFLRFGGWGIGFGAGSGKGDGEAGSAGSAGPQRCAIRVTAKGLVVDGKPATRDAAVETCKAAGGAIVIVTGDAREGDWTDLRDALDAAHVPVDRRGS